MIVWLNGTHGVGKTTTTLVMPMTVLVEQYWREINDGLAYHAIPVRHFVLHADQNTLRRRIEEDAVLGPSQFRMRYLAPYAEALRTWLHDEAEVIDTTDLTPAQAASRVAQDVNGSAIGSKMALHSAPRLRAQPGQLHDALWSVLN